MNTDNNQRFRDTESKVLSAYGRLAGQKALDKITVTDICREAKIHRTTFYGHFLDVLDLREKASRQQFQHLLEAFYQSAQSDRPDYRQLFLQELLFCYRHRKVIRKSFQSAGWDSSSFFPSILDNYVNLTDERQKEFMEQTGYRTHAELEYFQTFMQAGFLSILRKWILADCPESPEELADLLCRLYHFEE